MVSYRSTDGKQSYHQIDDLSDAIKYVEHLRNDEAVDQARIFKMEEVGFEFRPYYRVELAGAAPVPPASRIDPEWPNPKSDDEGTSAPADDVDPLAAAWSVTDRGASPADDDESVSVGLGRRGLFGR